MISVILAGGKEVLGIFPADNYIEVDQEFRIIIHRLEEL